MSYKLFICPESDTVRSMYAERAENREKDMRNSGVDLFVPEDVTITRDGNPSFFLSHRVKCRMVAPDGSSSAYFLFARSSIAKTPLILANSVGIIDCDYRGPIIAAFKLHDADFYEAKEKSRLCQICAPTLAPIEVYLVDALDETERGEGGFGSTGR